jgi:hypothetical protein
MRDSSISFSNGQSHPGHDRGRDKADCAEVLAYFREINRGRPQYRPSTAELTRDGRFGLRPPNRINDLVRGKFDGHRYDFERISGEKRGEFRWRLHEPNRPGYPKHKNQSVLPLPEDCQPSFHRNMSTARRSARAWKPQPIVPSRSWADVMRERNEKAAEPQPEFQLTP